jgi:hypothetical protein
VDANLKIRGVKGKIICHLIFAQRENSTKPAVKEESGDPVFIMNSIDDYSEIVDEIEDRNIFGFQSPAQPCLEGYNVYRGKCRENASVK